MVSVAPGLGSVWPCGLQPSGCHTSGFKCRTEGRCGVAFRRFATLAVGNTATGCCVPLMPGPQPRALARHKQSTGLFESGRAHPSMALRPAPPSLLRSTPHPAAALLQHRGGLRGGAPRRVAGGGRWGEWRSEVKTERQEMPGSGDTSGVVHPMPLARDEVRKPTQELPTRNVSCNPLPPQQRELHHVVVRTAPIAHFPQPAFFDEAKAGKRLQ